MKISKFMGGNLGRNTSQNGTRFGSVIIVSFFIFIVKMVNAHLFKYTLQFFTKKLESKEKVIKKKNGDACDTGLCINMHQDPQTWIAFTEWKHNETLDDIYLNDYYSKNDIQ